MQNPTKFKLFVMSPLFVLAFFCFSRAYAANDLISASITNLYESSTKYFYTQTPVVTGVISDQVRGVIVRFDNAETGQGYSVTVDQSYPATSFTTQNDCFSSSSSNASCSDTLPLGVYKVTVEASLNIYDASQTLVFPKLLEIVSSSQSIDRTAPNRPILDPISSPTNADTAVLSGTAEAGSLVNVTGANQTKSDQLTSGSTHFSITVSLVQNSQNSFSVTAMDSAGNTSSPATCTIEEITPSVAVPISSTVSKDSSAIVAITSNPTGQTPISGSTVTTPSPVSVGAIKGESTENTTTSPSKAVMALFYASIVLFFVAWGLYFQRIYLKKRPHKDIDKKLKKKKD